MTKRARSAKSASPASVTARLGLKRIFKSRLQRSPHRSFKLSKRRDYVRGLALPGYFGFVAEVLTVLAKNRRLFIGLIVLYAAMAVLLGGISNQNIYELVSAGAGEEQPGVVDTLGQAGLAALLMFTTAGVTSNASGQLSEVQQVYLALMVLLVWLCTVWLLRELLADRKPRLRDSLYNAGAPIISTIMIFLIMLFQLLPAGLLAIIYIGLNQVGLATEGLGAMLFFAVAALVITLTLYWVTSTFMALVIATLPGMYPVRAWRLAGELVMGRRLRIMYRIVWMAVVIVLGIIIVMTPVILLNQWLISIAEWVSLVPIVPLVYAIVASTATVFAASYIYFLYRKVVAYDDEKRR